MFDMNFRLTSNELKSRINVFPCTRLCLFGIHILSLSKTNKRVQRKKKKQTKFMAFRLIYAKLRNYL